MSNNSAHLFSRRKHILTETYADGVKKGASRTRLMQSRIGRMLSVFPALPEPNGKECATDLQLPIARNSLLERQRNEQPQSRNKTQKTVKPETTRV